jgi:peptidoglycan/LPS O-acetylase OafA/YrhL
MHKNAEIQGLRALAILFVVSIHILYAPLNVEVFRFGFLGVQLFFMISGYVVFKSALNTRTILQFFLKRIVRIYPPLIFAIILNLFVYSFYNNVSRINISLVNVLFSALLLEPRIINIIFHSKIDFVDPVYWTLIVEAKFYFLLGLTLHVIKRAPINYIKFATLFSAVSQLVFFTPYIFSGNEVILAYVNAYSITGIQYLSWFLLGIISLNISTLTKNQFYILSFLNTFLALSQLIQFELAQRDFDYYVPLVGLLIIMVFYCRGSKYFKPILNSAVMLRIGNSSYELYLFHMPLYLVLDKVCLILNYESNVFRNTALIIILVSVCSQIETKYTSKIIQRFRDKFTIS